MLGFKEGYSIVRIAFLNDYNKMHGRWGLKGQDWRSGSEGNEWMEMKWRHEWMETPRFKKYLEVKSAEDKAEETT